MLRILEWLVWVLCQRKKVERILPKVEYLDTEVIDDSDVIASEAIALK